MLLPHQLVAEFEAVIPERDKQKLKDGVLGEVLRATQEAIVLPPWVALADRPRPEAIPLCSLDVGEQTMMLNDRIGSLDALQSALRKAEKHLLSIPLDTPFSEFDHRNQANPWARQAVPQGRRTDNLPALKANVIIFWSKVSRRPRAQATGGDRDQPYKRRTLKLRDGLISQSRILKRCS